MDEHRAMCRLLDIGQHTVIFCVESGSGKSTAVDAMVHGEFRMQPDRSLTIKFHLLNQNHTELNYYRSCSRQSHYLGVATYLLPIHGLARIR
jgi:hypothetical protein